MRTIGRNSPWAQLFVLPFLRTPTKAQLAKASAAKPRVLASSATDLATKDPKTAELPKGCWRLLSPLGITC